MFHALDNLPDHLLLKKCKEGSKTAFNALFRRYFDDLLQFTSRQIKDHELAEELVMDLMLRLWQKKDAEEIEHLGQYLFRSMKNAMISHWRKKALSFSPLDDLPEYCAPLSQAADYNISLQEAEKMYMTMLADLTPQRRLVYTLSREQEMTNEEIALETNLSVNTVKNHLKASLNYFRENLKPYTEATFFVLLSLLF